MPRIDDLPASVTDAGHDHNYTGPDPATVTLVNAPVDSAMRVFGLNREVYDAFVDGEMAAGRAYTAINVNAPDPRSGVKLETSISVASQYNYARVRVGGRSWYMFIDRVEWRAVATTAVHMTVDPIATYGWSLGYSMVDRAHAGVAASQNDTYGSAYCLTPEPVSAPPVVASLSAMILDSDVSSWTVLVVSSNDLRGNGTAIPYFEGHVHNVELKDTARLGYMAGVTPAAIGDDISGDVFYPIGGGDHGLSENLFQTNSPWYDGANHYVPNVRPSSPSQIDGVTQGGGVYLFTPGDYLSWVNVMQNAPWVMEGISDVRLVPTWAMSITGVGTSLAGFPPDSPTDPRWNTAASMPQYISSVTTEEFNGSVLDNWRSVYLNSIPGGGVFRKILTSAFTKVVLANGESTVEYAPEAMQTPGVNVHARTGVAHGENSIRATVDYNQLTEQMGLSVAAGGNLGFHSSGYGRAASNTGGAVMGALNAAYTNYSSRQSMSYNYALAKELNIDQAQMNMGIIGVQSVMQAAAGAGLAGMAGAGPAGAAIGAVVGGATSLITAGVSANQSLDLLNTSKIGSMDIGTYQLGLNGVFNAMTFRTWVQALRAVSGAGHNARIDSAWRHLTGNAFQVLIMTPREGDVRELVSTWRRYGYTIGRAFKPSRLDVMSRFSYWKTTGATITGGMPHDDRKRIAEAFDAGVTIYSSLYDIGNDVSASNDPVSGFSY